MSFLKTIGIAICGATLTLGLQAEPQEGKGPAGGERLKGERPVPRAVLEKYDKDGDGKLNQEERDARHADLVAKYDKDGDGKLNEEEREAMKADLRERVAEKVPPAVLEKYDKDGDGELSKEERQAMREARIEKGREAADKDGDGVISAEERAAVKEKIGERREKKGDRAK